MKKPPSREQALLWQRKAEKRAFFARQGRIQMNRMRAAMLGGVTRKNSSGLGARDDRQKIVLPERVNLTENFSAVIAKINELRDAQSFYLNLNPVRHISAAAALMFVAELEVHKLVYPNIKIRARDAEWDKDVRARLEEMGFLRLLKSKSQLRSWPPPVSSTSEEAFVRFVSGRKGSEEEYAEKLIKEVERVFRAEEIEGHLRIPLYAGLTEAIINANQHAYSKKEAGSLHCRWWISASVNRQTNEIRVMCYDRGRTIPGTIQASEEKVKAYGIFSRIHDHEIMRRVMEEQRTSTGNPHQGLGLSELRELIDSSQQGALSIYSGKGLLKYSKFSGSERGDLKSSPLPGQIEGTLVEWSIILPKHS